MEQSPDAPLIICFGDSLTAGYQAATPDHPQIRETPPGAVLQEALGARARVAVSGICGELTGEMVMRFRHDVLDHKPSDVIILGGTNDLGWNAQPNDIMRNLIKVYELARAARIVVVAVTVPSLRVNERPDGGASEPFVREHIARRMSLNRMISDYCASKSLACVDLFAATAEPDTLLLAPEFSNDGLHLTTEGYQCFAHLLYDQVFAPRFGLAGDAGHRSER